jgi:hypothetical protein
VAEPQSAWVWDPWCRKHIRRAAYTAHATAHHPQTPAPQPSPNDPQTAAPVTNAPDAWRKALADRARQLRNKRGKRPPPPITGVIIPRQSGKAT